MPAPAPQPERLGSIRILELAGQGAMGAVYRGFDEAAQREVAVKLLLRPVEGASTEAQRFLREMELLASLSHPNLLRIHGAGEFEGNPYMVSEWLPGQDLAERVETQGPYAAWEALELGLSLARGVAAAHARGVLHRDLKPENVVLDPTRGPVLIDFGLAKAVEGSFQGLTATGTFAGTPAFAAPEQFLDAKRVDARADVFSLGGTIYYLLTGVAPTGDHQTLGTLLAARAAGEIPSARELVPSVPAGLNAILERAMSADREHRYPDAGAMVEALEAFEAGGGDAARSARSRPLLALIALVLALGVAWGLARASSGDGDRPSPAESSQPAPSLSGAAPSPSAALSLPAEVAPPWALELEQAQLDLDGFVDRTARRGPRAREAWRASVAELRSRISALSGLPPLNGGSRAIAARGAALADRAHWLPALELLSEASLRSERCALTWSSTAAVGQLVSGGDPSLALPTLKDLALRSPGTPIARLAELWAEVLAAPAANARQIEAWLKGLAEVQPVGQAPRWLGREVWIAVAFVLSRCGDDPLRVQVAGTLDERLARYGQLPIWSQAFVVPYLLGWREAKRALLTPSQLAGLELMVTLAPLQPTVEKLGWLYATQGYLGALGRLDELRSGAELSGPLLHAERFLDARLGPRAVTGVVRGRRYRSLIFPPGVERVRLAWDLPEGPWTLRLRGAPRDFDLWVRRDGPPLPGSAGVLNGATFAWDEQVSPEGPSEGLHQVVIASEGPSPEPIYLTLDLFEREPKWIEPRAVRLEPALLRGPAAGPVRRLSRERRHLEALRILEPAARTEPELQLWVAALRARVGVWDPLPLPSAPLRPEVQRALIHYAGEAALARADYAEAEARFAELLREEVRYLRAWEGLALAQLGLRRPKLTIQTLIRCARQDPLQETPQGLAVLLDLPKRSPARLEAIRALFNRHAHTRDYLSRALLLADPALLIAFLQRAQPILPRDQVRLARAQLAAGDPIAARETVAKIDQTSDRDLATQAELDQLRVRLSR